MNPDCQRSFVIDRSFRGGINHPTQSKKPKFHRLVFVEDKTIREACDALGLSMSAGDKWFRKMVAVGRQGRSQMSLRAGSAPSGIVPISAQLPGGSVCKHPFADCRGWHLKGGQTTDVAIEDRAKL
jgi:hypothetical protein